MVADRRSGYNGGNFTIIEASSQRADPMTTIRFSDHPRHILQLMDAALAAADPAAALERHWPHDRLKGKNIFLIGAGKAALEMGERAWELLEGRVQANAVAVVPERMSGLSGSAGLNCYPAAHPLPDERNVKAANAIKHVAEQAASTQDAVLLALISGGGSAHLTLPAGFLTLGHLRDLAEDLMRAGAPIEELNAVRKHCEVLKGGGLARIARPASVIALLLSDVIGDPLDVIASGPAAPDRSTYSDALSVLEKYGLPERHPEVVSHLEAGKRGEFPETLKAHELEAQEIHHIVIGSNTLALEAVSRQAAALGFKVVGIEQGVRGEASEVGKRLAARVNDMTVSPSCYLIAGETTVTVRGKGRGGRNQELALAAALGIEGSHLIAIASFATDGVDGPTDAAGAIVTGQTVLAGLEAGYAATAYLAENDSYTYFEEIGGLIRTGPTGTNVNDVAVLLKYEE